MTYRLSSPPKRPSKITVPEKANPLAKLVFSEMRAQSVTYADLEWKAGVLILTFKAWRSDNRPGLETIEAALGALGWSLVPVPRKERLPKPLQDALDVLADEWASQEPLLHHLLATCCKAPPAFSEEEPAPVITWPARSRKKKAIEPKAVAA
jgi:hypothetical protein